MDDVTTTAATAFNADADADAAVAITAGTPAFDKFTFDLISYRLRIMI